MKPFLTTLIFSGSIVLSACGGGGSNTSSSTTTTPPGQPVSPVTVSIIHYNDLHAHMTPHWDKVADATGTKVVERGGLARIATMIKQIRQQNPNSILINVGDTFHGGVEALYTLGNAAVDPVNALGIDVGVPGNWDYGYGPEVTRLRFTPTLSALETNALTTALKTVSGGLDTIKRPNYPNLAANVTYSISTPFHKAGDPFLPATLILNRGGVNIGFIGISSDIVPQMSTTLAMGLNFVQGQDNYKALIEQQAQNLRTQGAQIIVVMSELGIHKDKALADLIAANTVDVFFSAHTHEATFTPLQGASGALVVEAGNDGYVGRMDITLQAGVAPKFNWNLLAVDRNVAEDATMKTLVDNARAPFLVADPNMKLPFNYVNVTLHQSITTVVGKTTGAVDRRAALENSFNRAFADALRGRTGTQLAMTPGFRFDSVLAEPGFLLEDNTVANGDITLEDVYRFFPVVYTISTANIDGKTLKSIAESSLTKVFSKTAFNQGGGWVEGFSGLGMQVNVAGNDGQRIQSAWLTDTKTSLSDATIYSITGCTRPDDAADVLCSYSGFTNVQPYLMPGSSSAWTVTDLFVDMLKTGPLVSPTQANFTDTSNTPVWPQAPFVQPIW